MTEVLLIIAGLYLLIAFFILLGVWFVRKPADGALLPSGSVIICARDEEEDLPACLDSLEKQVIPPEVQDRLEVILVDDTSQDRTGELMEEFARTSRLTVRVLHMSPPQPGEPSAKWRALKEGINLAQNEGLLLTDADAKLPPDWVEKHLQELGSNQIVAGFALIEGASLWGRIQCLDWLFLLGVSSGLNRLGIPQAALGKNLSLRRSDYQAVGGLEKIGFSLTEDLSLVQAIVRHNGKFSFPLSADIMVTTPGVSSWGEFLHQRKRWASGIRRLKLPGQLCIATMALRHFAVIAGIIAGLPEALWAWAATAFMNFLILQRITAKLRLSRRLWSFLFWELFYTWTAPLVAIRLLNNRRVVWKGRNFSRSTQPAESAETM